MSQSAVFDLSSNASLNETLFGAPNQEYVGRVANFIADLMRGTPGPLGVLIDVEQKRVLTLPGADANVIAAINECESFLSGSGQLNGEVFTPNVDQIEAASADFTMRHASIDISLTDDDSGIAAALVPELARRSLSSMVEKIHSGNVAKMIAVFQQSPAALNAEATGLDPLYERGNIYAINQRVVNIYTAFENQADHNLVYTDGDAVSQAAASAVKDTFGL